MRLMALCQHNHILHEVWSIYDTELAKSCYSIYYMTKEEEDAEEKGGKKEEGIA